MTRGDDPRSSHARVHLPAVRRDFAASIRRFIAPGEEARAMSTLYVSRSAVEGAAAIFGRCGGAKYTATLRAHFAGSRAHVPRAALWH